VLLAHAPLELERRRHLTGLRAEVARQDWRLFAADVATVFDLAADKMWPELSRQGEFEWTERLRREDLIVTVSQQ